MKKHWPAIKQFLQFNIVGILNTAVDFAVYTLLTELLHVVYIPAKIISYACGILNSYILNSSWTFKKERRRTKREVLLFIAVNLVTLCVSLGMMALCRNVFLIQSDFLCNVIATPVSMVLNFLGNKFFVFSGEKKPRVK
ncbi:GtrA family protein [Christensenellaceae bacterium OttesenSCG-928-L17]|nr:GtrA family protein [Christensenellaceae bacterium OttesenSCG-928-L17]